MFDDKMTSQAKFCFNDIKGGMAGKSKVEPYFVTQAPFLRELLERADAEDNQTISEAKFLKTVLNRLSEEQAMNLNG